MPKYVIGGLVALALATTVACRNSGASAEEERGAAQHLLACVHLASQLEANLDSSLGGSNLRDPLEGAKEQRSACVSPHDPTFDQRAARCLEMSKEYEHAIAAAGRGEAGRLVALEHRKEARRLADACRSDPAA